MKKSEGNGFTMIELVVALSIAVILSLSMVAILAPVYRTYQRTLLRSDAQLIAGNVIDAIRTGAANAATVTSVEGNSVDVGRGVYGTKGGKLIFSTVDDANQPLEEEVFDTGYYNGKTVSMTCETAGYNMVRVSVSISGSGLLLCNTEALISPMRRVLEDGTDANTMSNAAEKVSKDNPGMTGEQKFDELFVNTYGGKLPQIVPTSLIAKAKLESLIGDATLGLESRTFYASLLNASGTNTFYVAAYYTAAGYPVVYMTDQTGAAAFAGGASAAICYMVYYEGNWYVRQPANTFAVSQLAGLSRAAYIAQITNGDGSNLWANINDI